MKKLINNLDLKYTISSELSSMSRWYKVIGVLFGVIGTIYLLFVIIFFWESLSIGLLRIIFWFSLAYIFLAAILYFTIGTGLFEQYIGGIKRGANMLRWIEYSMTSSIMMVILGLLAGINNWWYLIGIFFINVGVMVFGAIADLNRSRTFIFITSTTISTLLYLVEWLLIQISITDTPYQQKAQLIITIMFFIFLIFPIIFISQRTKIFHNDHVLIDKFFTIASIFSKAVLLALLFIIIANV